jgi:hypothetical protein
MDSLLRFVKYHVRDKESSENQPLKCFSMSLLSRTLSPLNPYSVKDPLFSQPFWNHGLPIPTPYGATDPLSSQPYWCHAALPSSLLWCHRAPFI